MDFNLKIKKNIYNFMRDCGYHPEGKDEKTGELVFARRLGASDYPRFHTYVSPLSDGVSRETFVIKLHLDQKKPIYKGVPAHAAEYEGEVIEKEAERIKKILGR